MQQPFPAWAFDPVTGKLLCQQFGYESPDAQGEVIYLNNTTTQQPPVTAAHEAACYLDAAGKPVTEHNSGLWSVIADWVGVQLWNTHSGQPVSITELGITPDDIDATDKEPPSKLHSWQNGAWQEDSIKIEAAQLAAAELELGNRDKEAKDIITRIEPAVVGGYAKQEDIDRLPHWQRYRYELPDVRAQPKWPASPIWPLRPGETTSE
ncbi:tail fiber assembly protein [Aeromonas bestiarum]|uniref:Tail fiber assembly protein n=1 Tax=Aeromonas bestiarum TaxID=105751 RepID=A0AAW7I2K7_9GAMM|nr:tail fiber assembly protein [Aeromonas bestiarum]MDM5141524.1 tail fiber assembly protein [Aeromonas bestiarum]